MLIFVDLFSFDYLPTTSRTHANTRKYSVQPYVSKQQSVTQSKVFNVQQKRQEKHEKGHETR